MLIAQAVTSMGVELDASPQALGELQASNDMVDDPAALRHRMKMEGYLFFRRLLDRATVLEARQELCQKLLAAGEIDGRYPLLDAVAAPGTRVKFAPQMAAGNAALHRAVYDGAMMALYRRLIGRAVRHYDYTWIRAISPGPATPPHQDVVYMGRGCTDELYTSWTPLGDLDLNMGGLMVLERSHGMARLNEHYGKRDVDSWCVNRRDGAGQPRRQTGNFGELTANARRLGRTLGRRWLTCPDYRAGDVVMFSVYVVHGGLDNHTDRIRLSADTRYQPADQPVDDRWVSRHGQEPVGHGDKARKEMIC